MLRVKDNSNHVCLKGGNVLEILRRIFFCWEYDQYFLNNIFSAPIFPFPANFPRELSCQVTIGRKLPRARPLDIAASSEYQFYSILYIFYFHLNLNFLAPDRWTSLHPLNTNITIYVLKYRIWNTDTERILSIQYLLTEY